MLHSPLLASPGFSWMSPAAAWHHKSRAPAGKKRQIKDTSVNYEINMSKEAVGGSNPRCFSG